jgi:hypothetical protein
MTETAKKASKHKPTDPFFDKLLDQLFTLVSAKGEESMSGEFCLAQFRK